ncbi:alanine racemase [Betaproteobacteria bacterium]|nr:alanine racemase [Betaproteobacteria bacterium]
MSRPAKLIIYTNSFKHNLNVLKAKTKDAKIWACVKAGAYGHGIESIVEGLKGADGLAVLEVREAMEARELGWEKPILLLEGIFSRQELHNISNLDLEIVVHNSQQIEWCLSSKKKFRKIWVKINSGMNRLGFKKSGTLFCSDTNKILNHLRVSCTQTGALGWMTHFAVGESTKFCSEQEKEFKKTITLLGFRDGESISYSNSDAIIYNSKFCSDWVRPGILLYGAASSLNPNYDMKAVLNSLQPCQALQTEIIAKQIVKAGEAVGYGKTFVALNDMVVGIAAIGYADGYPRSIKKGTCCIVEGKRCQIVGVVSMDLIHIDLSDCPEATLGSVVEFWGKQMPITEVAQFSGRLCYELFTGITSRVTRKIM